VDSSPQKTLLRAESHFEARKRCFIYGGYAMSIRLMSLVFEAEIPDLEYIKNGSAHKSKASTAKLLLLAISDHANDEGESAYPGFTRLERKSCLSRQGISDTLDALKANGYVSISDDPSRVGTNNYTINLALLVKPLDYHQSSHLTTLVKPLDHNHHLTTKETPKEPTKQIQKHGDLVQGYIDMSQMPGMKKTIRIDNLESIIKVKTGVEPTRKAWKPFLEFVDSQQQKEGKMLVEFLDWLQSTPKFDISFWGPDRMRENWDRAFESATKITTSADGGMYV
jgi:hypothetical protein